jgi:hypothetical protein
MSALRQPREVYRVLTEEEYLASGDLWTPALVGSRPGGVVDPDGGLPVAAAKRRRAPQRVLVAAGMLCGGLGVLLAGTAGFLGSAQPKRPAGGTRKAADSARRPTRARMREIFAAARSRHLRARVSLAGTRAFISAESGSGRPTRPRARPKVLSASTDASTGAALSKSPPHEPATAGLSSEAPAAAEFGFER